MGNKLIFPKKARKTHGGVKAPHRKNTSEAMSLIMPPPKQVTIPMSQHIGAPCVPIVKVGDHVDVGQLIGDSDKFVSAPIHSSVSGTVEKIIKLRVSSGQYDRAVVIASDGKMTPFKGIKPFEAETLEELMKATRESGLVGLGGAGFPAHVKLNIPKDKKADTLIINCAECEPYITSDHREAIENSWDIFTGIYVIKDILKIERVIIGVEDNKPDVIKVLSEIADNEKYDPDNIVRVLPLKASYPQGAEKVLIKACTNREVPLGKLPIDVGCIVMNVASVAFMSRYMKTGMPLVSKRITVDGSAIAKPCNVIVPIGTAIKDVIEFCGGYSCEPSKILMGGPMMGTAITSDEEPIQKRNNAILAFDEKDAMLMQGGDCIRCGRCVKACPMLLTPPAIEKAVKLKDFDALTRLGVMNCMECGCCSFSCPAGKFIVQSMRLGKSMLRDYEKENGGANK